MDVAGKVAETLLLFEAAWSQDHQLISHYPLIWLSSVGDMLLDQVKTRLEFMSSEILDAFESRFGQNPFVFRHVRVFASIEELAQVHPLSRPMVIVTTSPYLESGDSRELFLRLCQEPHTLLWLLGVPPSGTLARQLLDDFVVGHCTRKEYRVQQSSKHALPDQQLRAFYESKMQELADSSQKGPDFAPQEPLFVTKAEQMDGDDGKAEAVEVDAPGVKMATKQELFEKKEEKKEVGKEGLGELKLDAGLPETKARKEERPAPPPPPSTTKEAKGGGAALWAPVGWPQCRILSHTDARPEGDEYGHLLGAAELKSWKSQDQEGNKYGFASAGDEDEGAAGDTAAADDEDANATAALSSAQDLMGLDWRDSLRVHFREPMRFEVRDRTVRVACRVRFLPETSQEPKDLHLLVSTMAPKHVVLLPAGKNTSPASAVMKHIRHGQLAGGNAAPRVHSFDTKVMPLRLPLMNLKRKVQFTPEFWERMSFLRTSNDVRVARVCASAGVTANSASAEDPAGAAVQLGVEALPEKDATALEEDAIPRGGALFLSVGKEPLSLSGLREQLRQAGWAGDAKGAEFHGPMVVPGQPARPWSARVLSADGKAVLGWTVARKERGFPVLRVEGAPGDQFFQARAALYQRCAVV
eukprot:gnl/TRDRNA2_/TRDRNA2_97377_c0_seq1.p1 gnl/TRDRNA2_/TRDRNA2_97377_c0~~gnl/TRDRNA2_/TRDRNA2_97377_c0_seq1.p1  ORF type:complete len:691 (-),score=169.87 gnl/TRDRNA2_/TRDRNA2_97377_c0_seq1:46-1968(-)